MARLKPKAGSVEITTRCNAGCLMCPHTLESVRAEYMKSADVIDIVGQEVAMGCKKILMHHLGEPTLHPDYVHIWRTVRANHTKTHLRAYTNGSQIHRPEIAAVMAECADDIVVSIDGTTAAGMETVRPGVDAARLLPAVVALYKRKRRGPMVVRGVHLPGVNDAEMATYQQTWRARGVDAVAPILDVRQRPAVFPNPCSRIYQQIDVRVDGTVGVCCRDPTGLYPLGNVFDQPLADIWYGDAARKFRRDHRAGDIDLCVKCTWEGVYPGDDYEELE